MDVDRVSPIARGVRQNPMLDTVRLDMDPNVVAVHELAIDRPLPVQPIELEGPDDARSCRGVGQRIELRLGCRVDAVVLCEVGVYVEPQQHVPLAGCQYFWKPALLVDNRTLSVYLVQAIFQKDRFARERSEVDDDVHTLRDADSDTGDLDGRRQEVAVIGNHKEWVGRRACREDAARRAKISRQEEFIEARRTGVEQPEAVAARLDLKERLDLAVDQELITQDAVQVEQVKGQQLRGGIVHLVGKDQRNIALREVWKTESSLIIAGVELVEQEIVA